MVYTFSFGEGDDFSVILRNVLFETSACKQIRQALEPADPYIILSPHHPARHLGHLHAAAGHGLHHLARVVELLLRAAMSAPSARNRRPWAFIRGG